MMQGSVRPAGLPWYRHFWPWFIVGLLGASVAGSLATVVIALGHADVDVRIAERAAARAAADAGRAAVTAEATADEPAR